MRFSVTSSPRVRFSVECAFPHLRKRGASSRKSAVCSCGTTEKRILQPAPHGKAHSARWASRKSAFCTLSLTEKRILHVGPHVKAHSGPTSHGKVQFAAPTSRRLRLSVTSPPGRRGARNPPPGCGALWKMAQLGKCVRATPRQAAGGGCARVRKPRFGA